MVRLKGTHYFIWRYRLVLLVMTLFVAVVVVRAAHLHIFEGDFLRDEGRSRSLRYHNLPAHRGMVYDRNGSPLAVSTPVLSVTANPASLYDQPDALEAFKAAIPDLAPILEVSPATLLEKVEAHPNRSFVYLKRRLPPHTTRAAIEALNLPGVDLIQEYKRYYPASEATAHLIGFTNIDDQGQEGIELAYDRLLGGVSGAKRVIKDRKGRVVKDLGVVTSPTAGHDLSLSIDLRMQHLAYRALRDAVALRGAESASLVAMDAETGEVLAMVNEPSFNPNDRRTFQASALRNRVLTDAIEPGSTLKTFTIAAAMEAGLADATTLIETGPGYMPVGRKLVKDFRNYGLIDVRMVLAKSSNVGAAKLALGLPEPEQLVKMLDRVGLGSDTGSAFPGETVGVFPVRRTWRPLHLATLSYGYGISVNLLQLARSYAIVANGGYQVPISLLKITEKPKGEKVIDQEVVLELTSMLEAVVSKEGTGSRAKISGYRVAGKTGTVHKLVDGAYSEDRYRAFFVGFALTQPKLVLAVMVDDPQGEETGGGEVAAPIFSEVMSGLLRLSHASPDNRYE